MVPIVGLIVSPRVGAGGTFPTPGKGPGDSIGAGPGAEGAGASRRAEKPWRIAASAWIILSLALMTPAVCASELSSLIDLPVTGNALVPESHYRDASLRAAGAGSPVDIALAVAGPFEGSRQLIVQANAGAESPTASRVTVIRDGLLDDSVRSERWDISLARTAAGNWEIIKVTRAWRCRRGATTTGFAAKRCP